MIGFQWRARAPFTAAPFAHTATCGVRTEWLSFSTGKEDPGQNGFSSGLERFVPSAGKNAPPRFFSGRPVVAKRQNGWAGNGVACTSLVETFDFRNSFLSLNLAEPVADARLCCARAPAHRHVAPRRPRSELLACYMAETALPERFVHRQAR